MPLEAGSKAPIPETPYPDHTGEDHVLADHLPKGPMLLGLYKSSCAASKAMMPILDRYHQKYGGKGLKVYGISQDSPNVTRSFVRRAELTFPNLIEGDEFPLANAFDIFATPTVFVVNKDGKITYTTMGFMRSQLEELTAAVAEELGVEAEPIVGADEDDVPKFVPG